MHDEGTPVDDIMREQDASHRYFVPECMSAVIRITVEPAASDTLIAVTWMASSDSGAADLPTVPKEL